MVIAYLVKYLQLIQAAITYDTANASSAIMWYINQLCDHIRVNSLKI